MDVGGGWTEGRSRTISINSFWFPTLTPVVKRIQFGWFNIYCAPCTITEHYSISGAEVAQLEFCFILAPANPSFAPKTQTVVCGDCSSTEGLLLLCLLPEGCCLFCISRRPFKTPARDLDHLLQHYAKNPQPVFLFHLILTGWFLYFAHWQPKLETWLKMTWLKFSPDKMNAQGW